MLICRRRSNRFLSSFDYLASSYNDWSNLKRLNGHVRLTICSLQLSSTFANNKQPSAMEKKSTNTVEANLECLCSGSSLDVTQTWFNKRTECRRMRDNQSSKGRSTSKERQQKHSSQNSKPKPKQVLNSEVVPTVVTTTNVAGGTSNFHASYLQNLSSNYHCPNTYQTLLFKNYLQNTTFNPMSNFGAQTFFRSFSESSVTEQLVNGSHPAVGNRKRSKDSTDRSNTRVLSSVRRAAVRDVRSWENTALGRIFDRSNGGRNPGVFFKVMSYNVLAQDLLVDHPELYKKHESRAMQWDIRWKNIFQEVKEHDCDILCLQEVQQSHLDKFYNKINSLGYSMLFKQRTGARTDGCAIYYKTNKFNLVEYITIEYKQPNVSLLDRDNIAIVATFSSIDNPSAKFVVATTHLLYNPKRADVRLAQTQLLLTEIERIAYRNLENVKEPYLPIIITGDFNSEPSSAIYNFIVNGKYDYENVMLRLNYKAGKVLIPQFLYITDNCQHADIVEKRRENTLITRAEETKLIRLYSSADDKLSDRRHTDYNKHKFSSGVLSHNFVFTSVYKHKNRNDIEGTTYQDEWITVDYIFYSGVRNEQDSKTRESKLKLVSRYTLPTRCQLRGVNIPNLSLGSDHLALVAKFKLEF